MSRNKWWASSFYNPSLLENPTVYLQMLTKNTGMTVPERDKVLKARSTLSFNVFTQNIKKPPKFLPLDDANDYIRNYNKQKLADKELKNLNIN